MTTEQLIRTVEGLALAQENTDRELNAVAASLQALEHITREHTGQIGNLLTIATAHADGITKLVEESIRTQREFQAYLRRTQQ